MKKLSIVLIALVCLTTTAFAGVSLYSTIGNSVGGGISLDLAPDLSIQVGGTGAADVDGDEASTYSAVVDLVYGNLGIGLELPAADSPCDINIKYIVEKKLVEGLNCGIEATVLKYDNEPVDGRELKIVPDISAYIVIPL